MSDQVSDDFASVAVCNYSDVLCLAAINYQLTPDIWRMRLSTVILLNKQLQHYTVSLRTHQQLFFKVYWFFQRHASSVLLWPSQPRRFTPEPLPSSAGLHCGPSCRLETKAWPSQTIVAQNGGDQPASTESWPGDSKATHAGQGGMAATRGKGNVDLDKLLKEDAHWISIGVELHLRLHLG